MGKFLRASRGRDFSYGDCSCLLWLCDFGVLLTGVDPGHRWRGRAATTLGAARIVKREGGIVALMDKAFAPLGWKRTDRPERGAVAIVEAPQGATGALLLGPARDGIAPVARKAERRGFTVECLLILAAWEYR